MNVRSQQRSPVAGVLLSLLIGLSANSAPLHAEATASVPVPGVDTVFEMPGASEFPDPKLDYKIVFDVRTVAAQAGQVSDSLEAMGKLINTFHKYGVSPEHMHMVAVFHGKSILLVTNDDTYQKRSGEAHNPNVELLEQLDKAGVRMVVCGVSAHHQNYDVSSLLPFVRMNLSATVTFLNLETRGYVRVEV